MPKIMCTHPAVLFVLVLLTGCGSSAAPETILGQWEPQQVGRVKRVGRVRTVVPPDLHFQPNQVLFRLVQDAVSYKASYRVDGKVVTVTTDLPNFREFMCTINDYKG